MRRLLLALPFALLPLAIAQASSHEHEHAHGEHGSLDAHEHGVAQLNVVLDGNALELELQSPAINLLGFEHAATSAADKAKVATAQSQLQDPQGLFGLTAADCSLTQQELESPLFETAAHSHDEKHADEHSEIHAHYQLDCKQPDQLQQLDLSELFERFPATEKIQVQLMGPNGQQGLELTPAQPSLSF